MPMTEAKQFGSSFLVAKAQRIPNISEPFLVLHRHWEKPKKKEEGFFPINLTGKKPLIDGYHLVYKGDLETNNRQLPIFVSMELTANPAEAKKIVRAISNGILSVFYPSKESFKHEQLPHRRRSAKNSSSEPVNAMIKLERCEPVDLTIFKRRIKAELKYSLFTCGAVKIWALTLCSRPN